MTDTINNVPDTNWRPDLRNSSGAKYIVLLQSMRSAIRSGELRKGAKMPPVREMAYQLGITPGTVARAYKLAVEEGLLEATVGRGTFVADSVGVPSTPADPLIYPPTPPDVIDLRGGCVPDVGQEAMIRAAMRTLAEAPAPQYLHYPQPYKKFELRQEFVNWLPQGICGPVEANDIVLTPGAQNAIMILLQTCLRGPSPVVLTEEICYPGLRYAAKLLRAEIIGIEMDAHGLRPDRLEKALRDHGGHVLFTSPHIHNPTTLHTPMQRRVEIADLARRYRLQIIEDESYHLFRQDVEPGYRALMPEDAWFIGSLSKCFSPSLRIGFIASARGKADEARRVMQVNNMGVSVPVSDIALHLFRSGNIARARDAIVQETERRVKAAVNILGSWQISWRPDGAFVWLTLPEGWRTSRFVMACEKHGVKVKAADDFALPGSNFVQAVRIGLNGFVAMEHYERALRQMAALLLTPPERMDSYEG